MNQKTLTSIILLIAAIIVAGIAGYFIFVKNQSAFPPYSVTADNMFLVNLDGYYKTCVDVTTIYKKINGSWEKVYNEFSEQKGLYYLDDKFIGYGMCDVVTCTKLPKPYAFKLVEYEKIGEKAPPAEWQDTADTLPVYQTVSLSGDVKIDTQYFTDKNCQHKKSISTFIKKPATPISTQAQQPDKTEIDFAYGEVIKSKIGINGGVIQNADKSVIVTIPPLKQGLEFTLSFKKSNFEVRSGESSPVTISIYPDISLIDSPTPINIKVKYDAKYDLPVPYLIDEKNMLHLVNLGDLDKENHYFTIQTFRGGDYSWIYDTELFSD